MNIENPDSYSKEILNWYERNARSMPWRISPADKRKGVEASPYKVWLSEVMLQQTTVAAVHRYYESFMETWPNVADLASADETDVLKAWAGLGYYSRARNLKRCADVIVAEFNGRFPESEEELLELPGIGPYTAAAIAAIAFDRPAAVVDGNVERVLSRVFAIDEPLPGAKRTIRKYAEDLTPSRNPGDYAQAVMDLGATICTPTKPNCGICPWKTGCKAHSIGEETKFPVKAARKNRPHRIGRAFAAVREDGAILLRRRPSKGLLASMTEIPGTEWEEKSNELQFGELKLSAPLIGDWKKARETVLHTFTHFHLELEVWVAELPLNTPAPPSHWWSAASEIYEEALPTVMKKAIAVGLNHANAGQIHLPNQT